MLPEEDLNQQLHRLQCQRRVKQFILTGHLHVLVAIRVLLGLSLYIQRCLLAYDSYQSALLWYKMCSNTWLLRLTSGISSSFSQRSFFFHAKLNMYAVLRKLIFISS